MRKSYSRNGQQVFEREVSDVERAEAIARYAKTHPEAARGTLTDCCGSATPDKEIDRGAEV